MYVYTKSTYKFNHIEHLPMEYGAYGAGQFWFQISLDCLMSLLFY